MRKLIAGLTATVLAAGSAFAFSAEVATAQSCEFNPVTAECEVGLPVTRPTTPGTPGGTDGGTGGGGGGDGGNGPAAPPPPDDGSGNARADCTEWRTVTGPGGDALLARLEAPAGYSAAICVAGPSTGLEAAFAPGAEPAPAPPTPEQLAATLYVGVTNRMHAPAVAVDPPEGTPSIVSLPVFVQVVDWVDQIADDECELGVCVYMVATPSLSFEPGEPGAEPIVCVPPGSRYDPAGGDPVVQAEAPGACAHVYTERTGVAGRPDVWSGLVVVTWDVQWRSTIDGAAGPSGGFDPISLSTPVPRVVDEVQTIVVDGSSS